MTINNPMKIEDGEKIRLARQERGMTQARLAYDLGINQAHVSQIESGTPQSTPALKKVCDFFGFTLEEAK